MVALLRMLRHASTVLRERLGIRSDSKGLQAVEKETAGTCTATRTATVASGRWVRSASGKRATTR